MRLRVSFGAAAVMAAIREGLTSRPASFNRGGIFEVRAAVIKRLGGDPGAPSRDRPHERQECKDCDLWVTNRREKTLPSTPGGLVSTVDPEDVRVLLVDDD